MVRLWTDRCGDDEGDDDYLRPYHGDGESEQSSFETDLCCRKVAVCAAAASAASARVCVWQ